MKAALPFVSPRVMARNRWCLSREDIWPLEEYRKVRKEVYNYGIRLSKSRRLFLGPYATIDFMCYDSMWIQVHEMLLTECRTGVVTDEQINDELSAYGALVPNGNNLTCTLFFEIDQEARRNAELSQLGGVEKTIALDGRVAQDLQDGIDRTDPRGKTSAVHFLSFEGLKATSLSSASVITCAHPHYPHTVRLTEAIVAELRKDFD